MNSGILINIFKMLPEMSEHHTPGHPFYDLLRQVVRMEVEKLFEEGQGRDVEFGPFGKITFPYHKMGAIDSLNLFDLDELIMFSFYVANKHRYKKALDIGANLGIHSIILGKLGYEITSFEPDATHFKILSENLTLNNITNATLNHCAVSDKDGETEFLRVLGNTTGSRIVGSTRDPYGDIERTLVETKAFKPLLKGIDLVKMDVEAFEKFLVQSTSKEDWAKTDGMLSVHDEENALALFEHFKKIGVNMFSQKKGWSIVKSLEDVPVSHHEGSLFVTASEKMHWG